MPWTIQFVPEARKELKQIDRATAARIVRTLEERIATLENPRTIGTPLKGEYSGLWRWRIGDYRIVARIDDDRILILVARVAHRRDVYR